MDRMTMMRRLALVAGVACAAPVLAATWYQKAAVTATGSTALTDLSFWAQNGVTGSGAPTADDELIAYNNWRLRINGLTCPAKSLQLGTDTTKCEVVHDSGVATFTNDGLKLVKGGWWFNAYNSDLSISGPVTVLSPDTAPFGLFWGQDQYSNRTATVSGPISGSAGTGFILGQTGTWVSALKSTFRLTGDLSNYAGTIFVKTPSKYNTLSGAVFGTRLLLNSQTTPCTINISKGCVLGEMSAASTTTVARVDFAAGTRFEPKVSDTSVGCLKVTDELTMSGPIEIYFDYILRGTGQYHLPILLAPASSTFTADDFKLVKGPNFYNRDLHFEVGTDPETGMRALYVVTWGFIYMSGNSYPGEGGRDAPTPNASSLTNAAAWWDNQVPHANAAYRLAGRSLRTLNTPNEDYDFPGVWLWLQSSSTLILSVKTFNVPTLYTSGGATIGLPSGSVHKPTVLNAGHFVFEGNVVLRAHSDHVLVLQGEIEGNGDIYMKGWSPTGEPQGFYEFTGLNTNFTGTISVSMDEYRAEYTSFEKKFPTFYVNDGRNLGGRRPAFTPRALTLTRLSRLSVTNATTVTLAGDLNRGVYVLEKGRFHAKLPTSKLEVLQPVLLNGHLWTEGEGTVVLGGATSFEETDGGAIVDVPRAGSNLVTVAGKTLVAAHSDCLNGCDVTFNAGTKLVLDLDAVGETGLNFTRSGSTIHLDASFGGKLPLSVTTALDEPEMPEQATVFGLVTVPDDQVAAVREMLPRIPRIWRDVAQQPVEIHDAEKHVTTFALKVQNQGTLFIFR